MPRMEAIWGISGDERAYLAIAGLRIAAALPRRQPDTAGGRRSPPRASRGGESVPEAGHRPGRDEFFLAAAATPNKGSPPQGAGYSEKRG